MDSKKLKIIQIIIHLGNGGTESLLREYITNIDANKFENIVICIQRSQNSASEKSLTEAGIKIYYIGDMLKNGKDIFTQGTNFIKAYSTVYKILKKEKPYAIHTHLATNRYLFLYSLFHNKTKYFHTVHCPVDFMFEGTLKNKIENICVGFLTSKRNMQLIALHSAMANELNERFNVNNTIVLENGIYLDKFRNPEVTKEQMRNEIGIPQDSFVLGHVGRMCPEKNHKLIVKVFAEILKCKPNSTLLLVGNGRCDDEVRQLIKDAGIEKNTIILSNRTDVNKILTAIDVFIFPSLFEGLGISLIEAEAADLKCVISDSIPKETYLSKKITVKSLTDSPVEWCSAIINDQPDFTDIGDIEKYNIKSVINKLENIYKGEYK